MKKLSKINLVSIAEKVNEVIDAIPRPVDLKPIKDRLEKLESIKQYDDSKIKSRLTQLEAKPGYNDTFLRAEIRRLEIKIPCAYNDKWVRDAIKRIENKPQEKLIPEDYDDSKLMEIVKSQQEQIDSLIKKVDYLKRTYSEKWARQQLEIDKAKSMLSK